MHSKLSKSPDNTKENNENEDNISEKIYDSEKKDDEYSNLYGNDDKDIIFQNNPTNYNPFELKSDNGTENNLSFLNLKRIRQNDDLQSVDSSENKYNTIIIIADLWHKKAKNTNNKNLTNFLSRKKGKPANKKVAAIACLTALKPALQPINIYSNSAYCISLVFL